MRVSLRRAWITTVAGTLGWAASLALTGLSAQGDQGAAVLTEMRQALGDTKKIDAVKSLSAEGSLRRVMGQGDQATERTSEVELFVVLPNQYQRLERFQLPNAPVNMPQPPRIATTLNGEDAWVGAIDPMPAGVNMRFGDGPGGRGGPGGGPGGPGGDSPNRARVVKHEYFRTLLGVLPTATALNGLTIAHAGVAEAAEGQADVLEARGPDNFLARLFIDKQTHLPLMMTYVGMDPRRMMMMRTMTRPRDGARGDGQRAGERPGDASKPGEPEKAPPAEGQRQQGQRQEGERRPDAEGQRPDGERERPQPVEITWFLADYKAVDGVMLPHRLSRSVDGSTFEEWEIKKYKLNPTIDPEQFKKKS